MNITCIICTDLLTAASEAYMTPCGHVFHYACLIQWIEGSRTCPQCRTRTTEKSILRVFFNIADTDHVTDDVGTLQHKIDNLEFQLTLSKKDVKIYKDRCKRLKFKSGKMREEFAILEEKIRGNDSVVVTLKDQLSYFKLRAKECDRLNDEIAKLREKLREIENVRLAIDGSREEVNDMLRTENNIQSLALIVATLKKSLIDNQRKKKEYEIKLKQSQNEVLKYRREVSSLEVLKNELKTKLEGVQEEKEYLKGKILQLDKESNLKRLVTESPIPIKHLGEKRVLSNDIDSPSVEYRVVEIVDSDSPYLPVKSSSVGLNSLLHKFATKSGNSKESLFKTHSEPVNRKYNDLTYDGLGGRSKEDIFPRRRSIEGGKKRPKTAMSVTSSKFRKLAPDAGFKKLAI